jgi:hypothetical protein
LQAEQFHSLTSGGVGFDGRVNGHASIGSGRAGDPNACQTRSGCSRFCFLLLAGQPATMVPTFGAPGQPLRTRCALSAPPSSLLRHSTRRMHCTRQVKHAKSRRANAGARDS